MQHHPFRVLSMACATLLSAHTTAQQITWGAVVPTIAASDVSLNGTLVVARNLHASGAVQSPTVNGVAFVGGFAPTGWTNASTLALQGSTTGDTAYDLLLNSARATSAAAVANPTGWGAIRLDTVGTLTVGHTYEIQCWFTDQRPGSGTAAVYDRVMTLSSAVGPATLTGGEVNNLGSLSQGPLSGPLDGDPDNAPFLNPTDVLFGSHCTGTFTRTSATDQLWLLVQGSHPIAANNLRSHLTAFQIRDTGIAGTVFATSNSYGTGCGGANPLSLTVAQRPLVNTVVDLTTGNITPTTPFGAVTLGLAVATPPVDLGPIGMAGCFQYHDNLVTLLYLPFGAGSALTQVTVPNLAGLPLQAQSFNYDPAAGLTLLGAVSSNALNLLCGDF